MGQVSCSLLKILSIFSLFIHPHKEVKKYGLYIHTYTHTYIHTYTHTYIYTLVKKYGLYIHTHIHTYIYTLVQKYGLI